MGEAGKRKGYYLWSNGYWKKIYEEVSKEQDVIYFCDEDPKKIGMQLYGIDIIDPEQLYEKTPDCVYIGVLTQYKEIKEKLKNQGGANR